MKGLAAPHQYRKRSHQYPKHCSTNTGSMAMIAFAARKVIGDIVGSV
jgi:hypothetical protein